MVSFVKKTMANKQIDMRKAKRIYKLYGEGASKRRISKELGISRNTVAKYIEFFKCYRLTPYEASEMTLEEIHRLFKADQKPKSEQLRTLERYFPYFDKELRKTGSRARCSGKSIMRSTRTGSSSPSSGTGTVNGPRRPPL